jgi:hypothetical protein
MSDLHTVGVQSGPNIDVGYDGDAIQTTAIESVFIEIGKLHG